MKMEYELEKLLETEAEAVTETVELTQKDVHVLKVADFMAEELMSYMFSDQPLRLTLEYKQILSDVINNIEKLREIIKLGRKLKLPVPSLRLNKISFVALDLMQLLSNKSVFHNESSSTSESSSDENLLNSLKDFFGPIEDKDVLVEFYSLLNGEIKKGRFPNLYLAGEEELRGSTKKLLSSFLYYRVLNFYKPTERSNVKPEFVNEFTDPVSPAITSINQGAQYLTITVITRNTGLSISSSPSYFRTWTYFGAPTTPVSGPILPGRYVFGGNGIAIPKFTSDTVMVNIPPTYTVKLSKI